MTIFLPTVHRSDRNAKLHCKDITYPMSTQPAICIAYQYAQDLIYNRVMVTYCEVVPGAFWLNAPGWRLPGGGRLRVLTGTVEA